MSTFRRIRPWAALAAAAVMLVFVSAADARVGNGFGLGSRGSRTFSTPPSTMTAPGTARSFDRTMTQPTRPSVMPQTSPGLFGGMFGRGLVGGLLGGFIGAGLFGLLFGHGLFGGMGGFASLFGLVLQLALVYFIGRLVWNWWQRRHQPAVAGGSPGLFRNPFGGLGAGGLGAGGVGAGGFGAGGFGAGPGALGGAGATASMGAPITLGKADFDTFERDLGDIQAAYGAEDLNHLRTRVTPEMLSYLADDLARNASRGVVNRMSDVKLLQGDLAEAWREGDVDYATVAMRYSAIDRMVDRTSGRVVEGDPDRPVEATELWTFRRDQGGDWLLSAIQQT